MPVTKCAVIYSTKNAHIRRIVAPDSDDSELLDRSLVPLMTGESIVLMSAGPFVDHYAMLAAAEGAVIAAAGKPLGNPRCAVIDHTGTVVHVIHADAEIDNVPGMTLVNHPAVEKGQKYVDGIFR